MGEGRMDEWGVGGCEDETGGGWCVEGYE